MNNFSFHPEAQSEFKDATIYHYKKSPSLALAFYTEVENAIQKLVEKPDLYHLYR